MLPWGEDNAGDFSAGVGDAVATLVRRRKVTSLYKQLDILVLTQAKAVLDILRNVMRNAMRRMNKVNGQSSCFT
jgi:hypothetical protein